MNVRVREIVIKAAERNDLETIFAANRKIPLPASPLVTAEVVPDADERLVEIVEQGDVAITRDVPLAARLVEKGAVVLNDRGDVWSEENIAERLSIRNAAAEFREAGIMPERGKKFGKKEVFAFANALDRELTRRSRDDV
ncbi:MAG: DUF188 domain-containing protein [Spirochaetales bacterium]